MSIGTDTELKALKTRAKAAKTALQSASEQLSVARQAHHAAKAVYDDLQMRITELDKNKGNVVVSEHAMLRYIERVRGIDLEALRAEMISPRTEAAIRFMKTGSVKADGYSLECKDMTVVTVLENA